MTGGQQKYQTRRRLERARAKISHAILTLESFGFGEDLELAIISAMSELAEAERLLLENIKR